MPHPSTRVHLRAAYLTARPRHMMRAQRAADNPSVRRLPGMTDRSAEFIAIAEEARELAERERELDDSSLEALEAAAEEVGRAWSKSNLGYQANVY